MNPAVTAAAIGVSGTVIVGVAGFGAAIWNTRRTIAHARETRVWDRRADVYVEALAALRHWRIERSTGIGTDDPELQEAGPPTHPEPDWDELGPRLQAFASESVFAAVNALQWAHEKAMFAITHKEAESARDSNKVREAARAARREALEAAGVADDAAVELIRTELQGKDRPIDDSPPDYIPPGTPRK